MFIVSLIQERTGKRVRDLIDDKHWTLEWAVTFAAVILIICFGCYGPGFDASASVYMQF